MKKILIFEPKEIAVQDELDYYRYQKNNYNTFTNNGSEKIEQITTNEFKIQMLNDLVLVDDGQIELKKQLENNGYRNVGRKNGRTVYIHKKKYVICDTDIDNYVSNQEAKEQEFRSMQVELKRKKAKLELLEDKIEKLTLWSRIFNWNKFKEENL